MSLRIAFFFQLQIAAHTLDYLLYLFACALEQSSLKMEAHQSIYKLENTEIDQQIFARVSEFV